VGEVLVWVGLFTLGTVSIGMGRGVVALCTSFAWFLFTVFTVRGTFTCVVGGGIYRGRGVLFAAIGELMWTQLCLGSVEE
jgi:hypothetical protein